VVRQGKGRKDRMIPIGARALLWIEKYRDSARPELLAGPDDGTVFLSNWGLPFEPGRITDRVRKLVDAANLGKQGACHLFRHTMATLMLENGADIRFIQAMLGHASLDTTQIYAQVGIRVLKTVHTATHPGRMPELGRKGEEEPGPTVDELLEALAKETEEDEEG
jgi:integrase/recombinase XerD